MNNRFFEKPILNSPYACPCRHWELDELGQPTQRIIENRRRAEFITPIQKPKKRKGAAEQSALVFDEGKGLSTAEQRYNHTAIINSVRQEVDRWRALPKANDWRVTPETARLLQHWRHHPFSSIRPFFCQVEAVETAIWLAHAISLSGGTVGAGFIRHAHGTRLSGRHLRRDGIGIRGRPPSNLRIVVFHLAQQRFGRGM